MLLLRDKDVVTVTISMAIMMMTTGTETGIKIRIETTAVTTTMIATRCAGGIASIKTISRPGSPNGTGCLQG
jgi:hypothetical protein